MSQIAERPLAVPKLILIRKVKIAFLFLARSVVVTIVADLMILDEFLLIVFYVLAHWSQWRSVTFWVIGLDLILDLSSRWTGMCANYYVFVKKWVMKFASASLNE